jgi:hypothetical protein
MGDKGVKTSRKLIWLVFAGLIVLTLPLSTAGAGNLDLLPDEEWAQRLDEQDMSELRGGFGGVAFSVSFRGFFDNFGNTSGELETFTEGTILENPAIVATEEQVQFQASVGSLNGANGIFNFIQVPGSMNVVNSSITIQVALVEVRSNTQVNSLLSNLFPGP